MKIVLNTIYTLSAKRIAKYYGIDTFIFYLNRPTTKKIGVSDRQRRILSFSFFTVFTVPIDILLLLVELMGLPMK